jgi:hypothetical protein
VLHLDVSVYKRLCYTWKCLSTGDFVLHLDVSATRGYVAGKCAFVLQQDVSQESVLHLEVSAYRRFCAARGRVCYPLVIILARGAPVSVLLCCSWTCLSTRVCATWRCLFRVEFLRNNYICFGCFDTDSNTTKNKKLFF